MLLNSFQKMQMMGMFIDHRHGKEPSHNSPALVGGSTGERRGWLTDLLHPATTASLTQRSACSGLFQWSKKELSGSIWKPFHHWFPAPGATTWTCCLRKSCAWRSDWSRSCRRRIWSASVRSQTQSRWMNEKRTWKRNIKIQSFLKSSQGLVSKDVLPKFCSKPHMPSPHQGAVRIYSLSSDPLFLLGRILLLLLSLHP